MALPCAMRRNNFEMSIAEIDALLPVDAGAAPGGEVYDPKVELLVVMVFQDGNLLSLRVPFEDILHRMVAVAMSEMFQGKPNTIQLNLDARD